MMLDYLGEQEAATKIHNAVAKVLKEGKNVTKDLNPHSTTGTIEMTDAIINTIRSTS